MDSASRNAPLQVDFVDPPDLTRTLQRDKKRMIVYSPFRSVYHCLCTQNGEVAVKVISFPRRLERTSKDALMRKVRYELGIWRKLDHPNIVPLLGTARGKDFGSNYPCMVSMWMPHGTLDDYINRHRTRISLPTRIRLTKGLVAGLEYLHSKQVLHGNIRPGNILIDHEHNARLTDFGSSQVLGPAQDQLSDPQFAPIRPDPVLWAAPELQHPDLYPNLKIETTLTSDIYSLGRIIFFIYSGQNPRPNKSKVEDEFQNPLRPVWPASIPDDIWNLIERCWSLPRNRPSAYEVLSFFRDGRVTTSDINVVLFGAPGCGKSSIINLLAEEPIAQISTNMEPCTTQPRCYQISIAERQFQFWDTTGFRLARKPDTDPLLAFEQAYSVLQKLTGGINLILLCVHKDEIASLGNLYWLINNIFYGGRAPIAFVATHLDTPDEWWWERNQDNIAQRTGVSVQSIPHACVTAVQTGREQSKQALTELLETYATVMTPISPRLDLSSHATASLGLTTHFGLSPPEATALVERLGRLQYAHQEDPGKSNPPKSEAHRESGGSDGGGGSGDFLEVEVSSSTPAPEFNYEESLSSSRLGVAPPSPTPSGHPREDEIPPAGLSHAMSGTPPVTSTPGARALENLDTISSHSIFRKWLQRKREGSSKGPTSHKLNRLPGKSLGSADHRSPFRSSAKVNATNEGPSWIAAGKRKPRMVATSWPTQEDKSPANAGESKHPNKSASHSGEDTADPTKAGNAQQVNDEYRPSAGMIRVTDQQESGYSTVAIKFRLPSWMLCRGSAAEDGTHG